MEYDVLIIGGGITGASIFYILNKYTNLQSAALIEKCPDFGLINSNEKCNSQTLHFGDIETNYGIEKAKSVKEAAEMMVKLLENNDLEKKGDIHKIA